MTHKNLTCPDCGGIGSTSNGVCTTCGAYLKFNNGELSELKVEGSDHEEVAFVADALKTESSDSSNWSDQKKWIMGIVSALILGILGWGGSQVVSIQSSNGIPRIALTSPADGIALNHFPRTLELRWNPASQVIRYVIEVEMQDIASGAWSPHINGSRFVSLETNQQLEFIEAQPGRWRVQGLSETDQVIAESGWWYFSFEN